MYRGGNYNNGANAGVFYVNGNNPRSNSNANIGFRSALALLVRPAGYGSAGTIKQKGRISRPKGQRYRPPPAGNRGDGQNRVDWPLSANEWSPARRPRGSVCGSRTEARSVTRGAII